MDEAPPVLWVGGSPEAGKTTVARLLARRHGLRWYTTDAHTWEHRDRAIAAGYAAAITWERMSRAERWTVPVEDMVAMSLHHERGRMITDVRALPHSPLVIAEGTPVTPSVSGPDGRAVWLVTSAEIQQARLVERGMTPGVGAFRLYQALRQEIEAQVEEYGGRKLVVDGRQSVADTVAEVEALFADALAEGPVATTAVERRRLLRYANRAVVSQHQQFDARPWAPEGALSTVYGFACECGHEACTADVELAVADFPRLPDEGSPPVLALGHQVVRPASQGCAPSAEGDVPRNSPRDRPLRSHDD
ncbi:hypothetical protein [Streptomyces vastus]|uniref:Uncharacterized protein n=1 Tax=Streptomyces vastus TaxID=285451 RepID=A0ABP6DR56_9ACTN